LLIIIGLLWSRLLAFFNSQSFFAVYLEANKQEKKSKKKRKSSVDIAILVFNKIKKSLRFSMLANF